MQILNWICLICSPRIQMSGDSNDSSVTFSFQTWSFALYWQDRDLIVKKMKIYRNIVSDKVQHALSLTNPKTLGLKLLNHNPSAMTIMVKDNEGFSRLHITAISGVVIISSHCTRGWPGGHQHFSRFNLIWVHSGLLARLQGLTFFPRSIPWFRTHAPQEHLITLYNWRILIFLVWSESAHSLTTVVPVSPRRIFCINCFSLLFLASCLRCNTMNK